MSSPMIGVLGGAGPRASAAFVTTIYDRWTGEHEQTAPRVVLYSDPALPDRNDVLLKHADRSDLSRPFVSAMTKISDAGAEQIVICCMTLHLLVPELPPHLRAKVVSMLDVAFLLASAHPGPHLLLCSIGARQKRLFEQHPSWHSARETLVQPSIADNEAVQQLIYRIKRGEPLEPIEREFEALMDGYGTASCVAACSELHLITRLRWTRPDAARQRRWLDPLEVIVDRFVRREKAALA